MPAGDWASWTELWRVEAGGRKALRARPPCGVARATMGVGGGSPEAPHANGTLARRWR